MLDALELPDNDLLLSLKSSVLYPHLLKCLEWEVIGMFAVVLLHEVVCDNDSFLNGMGVTSFRIIKWLATFEELLLKEISMTPLKKETDAHEGKETADFS